MMQMEKKAYSVKKIWIIVILAMAVIGVMCMIYGRLSSPYLYFYGEQGQVYLKLPIREKEEFSIEFVHSVNKSPVIDYYTVKDGDIYVTSTKYYSFGAGVQTELEGDQKLIHTDDGGMLVTGIDQRMEPLSYVVAMVSDHVLTHRNQRYSLEKLCGRGALVDIQVKRFWDKEELWWRK